MSILSGSLLRSGSACAVALIIGVAPSRAQVLEDVMVETYHVGESDSSGRALTTYRIYADLAEGCRLQMVFGEDKHQLFLFTTGHFHNLGKRAVKYADKLDPVELERPEDLLDSWLTLGAASWGHTAVPLTLDADGSILHCPAYTGAGARPDPLCRVDGMVADTSVREIVNFAMDPGYLGASRGQLLETTNGAWAVLGGVAGATKENMVLIAQITTAGDLSFCLNLQIADPSGKAVKCVARDPQAGEVHVPALCHGRDYHEYFRP